MPKAISLRKDYDADALRQHARASHDAKQTRRLLALAGVYDGLSRTEAAEIGAVDAQTLRDWAVAFNAAGPDGLISRASPGRPPKLSPAQKQAIEQLVEAGPDPETAGVVRWRRVDLKHVIEQRYGVRVTEPTVGRVLHERGFAHVSARPRHPRQTPEAIKGFKKNTA